MEVRIPAEQIAIVEGLVASGRFTTLDEAIVEGIRLLASNERLRLQVQAGVKQANDGDLVDHDTVFAELKRVASSLQTDAGK